MNQIAESTTRGEVDPRGSAKAAHIPALDGVRGLAVLIVFVYHFGGGVHSSNRGMQAFGHVNKGGWSGVILFFVLSGFLITGILWDSYGDAHWWRKFFARRALRIFPLYYFVLVLVVLTAIWAGRGRHVLEGIWIPLLFLENMPYLNFITDRLHAPLAVAHLWSIAVEEQFYLIWPFLLYTQKTRQSAKRLCVATFLLSLFFRIFIWTSISEPLLFQSFLLTQAGALAAGAWLAICYRGPEWAKIVRLAPVVALTGLGGFLLSGFLSDTFETSGRLMMTVGLPCSTVFFAGILILALKPGLVERFFRNRLLRWLGSISYGIYVYHMLFLDQFSTLTEKLAGQRSHMVVVSVHFVLAAVLSLLAAWLSFHCFEKQFLRFKKYFVPDKPSRLRV